MITTDRFNRTMSQFNEDLAKHYFEFQLVLKQNQNDAVKVSKDGFHFEEFSPLTNFQDAYQMIYFLNQHHQDVCLKIGPFLSSYTRIAKSEYFNDRTVFGSDGETPLQSLYWAFKDYMFERRNEKNLLVSNGTFEFKRDKELDEKVNSILALNGSPTTNLQQAYIALENIIKKGQIGYGGIEIWLESNPNDFYICSALEKSSFKRFESFEVEGETILIAICKLIIELNQYINNKC